MTGHTPGPWKASCFLVTDASGQEICHTGGTRYRGSAPQPHEAEANALLIASAPEQQAKIDALAAALERIAAHPSANGRQLADMARAALRAIGRIP